MSALGYLLKLVYAEGWEREMVSASSFIPEERSPCLLLSGNHSQKSKQSSPVHRRYFLDHCFTLSVSRLFAWQKQHGALWALSQPSLVTLKTLNFRDVLWWGFVLVFWGRVSLH